MSAGRPPRTRALAVLAVIAGAGTVVLATGRDWATVTVHGVRGSTVVPVDGRLAAPGAVAIALVAGAGAIVLATSGRLVRAVVAGLLLLAGLAVAALSVPVWRSPGTVAEPAVAKVTGTVGQAGQGPAGATPWPAVSAAGGLLIAAGGVTGLARGGRWPGPARRFEPGEVPGAEGRVTSERDRRLDTWDSLSRGEDPTAPPQDP